MRERSEQLQLIRKDHKGKKFPTFDEIWTDPCILKWASTSESSLILIQGSFQSSNALDTIATDLIDYLKTEKQRVVWFLKTPTEPPSFLSLGLPTDKQALKSLAVQILRARELGCSLKVLAEALSNLQPEQPEALAFTSLANILEENAVTYIVVRLEKFSATDQNCAKVEAWSAGFKSSFKYLETAGNGSIMKVVLLSSLPCPPDTLGIPVAFLRPVIAARSGLRNSALQSGVGSTKLGSIKLTLAEVPKAASEQPPPILITDSCHPPLELDNIENSDSLSPKYKRYESQY